MGIPKSGAKVVITQVAENGIIIDKQLWNIPTLVEYHYGERVKVRIKSGIAKVFDFDSGKQIAWFEFASQQKHVNCLHTFHPFFNE